MDARAPWLDSSSTMLANELRPEVEFLLRTLLHMLGNGAISTTTTAGAYAGGEILLNTEIEGIRFVLLSIPPAQAQERSLFSPREIEIARMVAKGYANKTIAAVLEISVNTVNTHLRRMFAKLDVTTRAAMVTCLANNYAWTNVLENVTHHETGSHRRWETETGEPRLLNQPPALEASQTSVGRSQVLEWTAPVIDWMHDGD